MGAILASVILVILHLVVKSRLLFHPPQTLSLGATNCQGQWTPGWFNTPPATLSASFENEAGGGCGSTATATVVYQDSSPSNTPESKAYVVDAAPKYLYTFCLSGGQCSGPATPDGVQDVTIYVDAGPTPTPIVVACTTSPPVGTASAIRSVESACVPASKASLVYAQAKLRIGFKTLSYRMKHGHACAYMVNMIQSPVTGVTLSPYVPTMVQQMKNDPSVFQPLTDLSQAVPGDIVVKGGGDDNPNDINDPNNPAMSHVGICANNGCTQIDSNSDSSNEFMNNYHNGPPMDGVPSTIFHVK